MHVSRTSILVTGLLQTVGVALAFVLAGSTPDLALGLGLALGIPLVLLALPRRGDAATSPAPTRDTVADVRRFAPTPRGPLAVDGPPAPLPAAEKRQRDPAA